MDAPDPDRVVPSPPTTSPAASPATPSAQPPATAAPGAPQPVAVPDNPERPLWRRRWHRSWNRAVRAIAAEEAPTDTWSLRTLDLAEDDRRSRMVVDLAARAAALALTTGSSCAEATAAALQVIEAYHLRGVHVDVSFSSVVVSHHRGPDRDANTLMRRVPHRAPDYARLTELQALLDRLPDLEVNQAREEFDRIVTRPRPYRRWVVVVASAVLGLGVALLLGGGWREVVITCVTTALVDVVHAQLLRRGLPEFFAQIAGAMVPTTVAVGVMTLSEMGVPALAGMSAPMVVAAGIVALLAGLSVVASAQDAIDGFLMTASARTFHVALLTIGIVLGVLCVLWGANLVGLHTYLTPTAQISDNPVQTSLGALVIALGFAIGAQTRLVAVSWCGVLGLIGWLVLLGAEALGLGYAGAVGLGATAVAIIAQLVAVRIRVAVVGLVSAGVVALLPGSMVYRGLFGLSQVHSLLEAWPAISELSGAATVGLAIAMGVSLGTWVGYQLFGQPRWRALRQALRSTSGAPPA